MSEMNDRELLELAAKAAGVKLDYCLGSSVIVFDVWKDREDNPVQDFIRWNPLEDDGDALRLAVELGICVTIRTDNTRAHQYFSHSKTRVFHECAGDKFKATRYTS